MRAAEFTRFTVVRGRREVLEKHALLSLEAEKSAYRGRCFAGNVETVERAQRIDAEVKVLALGRTI